MWKSTTRSVRKRRLYSGIPNSNLPFTVNSERMAKLENRLAYLVRYGVALLRGRASKSRGLGWNSTLHGSAITVHVSQQRFCNTSKWYERREYRPRYLRTSPVHNDTAYLVSNSDRSVDHFWIPLLLNFHSLTNWVDVAKFIGFRIFPTQLLHDRKVMMIFILLLIVLSLLNNNYEHPSWVDYGILYHIWIVQLIGPDSRAKGPQKDFHITILEIYIAQEF